MVRHDPVNSVLQVGYFPEIMQAEIDRRFTPTHHPDPQALHHLETFKQF